MLPSLGPLLQCVRLPSTAHQGPNREGYQKVFLYFAQTPLPTKGPTNHSLETSSYSLSHLPRGYCWVMDGDEVGRDSVAPPQLPRDAPVSTNSKGSVRVLSLCPSAGHPRHPGAIHTGCCPSKNATSAGGPQAGYGGHPGSQQHWRPGPSPRSARTTEALAEAPPHPWSGCSRKRVMERKPCVEHPEEPHPSPCAPVSRLTCKAALPWGCP